jgi:serine/threonine protein kinase
LPSRSARKDLKKFGPFELIERLGRGGMGTVYKARHPDYADPVAIKIAHILVAEEISLSQRFYNEYTLGKQLSHPNLVKVLDYGLVDEIPYLVMEYVPGCNLDQRIDANGMLSVDEALAIFEQLTTVVQFIHQKSLVHRDIKPANILIDPLGHVKLADLGLIKDQESIIPLTHSKVSLGTPDFGAPEQFEDAVKVDHRCDIYALGVTLYVSLTGVYPFGRASQAAVMQRKIMFEFAPLSRVLLKAPPSIDRAVIRALHPDPKMRHASAAEFMNEVLGKTPPAMPDLKPVCPESYRPESKDRRVRPRFAISIPGVKVTLHNSTMTPIDMDIINVSAGGVCLKSRRAYSIGSNLVVALPRANQERPTRVRVCWIHETANHRWLLGCHLATALKDEEFQALMDSHLPKTEVDEAGATKTN